MTEEELIMWNDDTKLEIAEKINSAEKGSGVLAVWPGTVVSKEYYDKDNPQNILSFFEQSLGVEIKQIVGTVITLPDREHRDMENPPTGGRQDFFFYFQNQDIPKVAVPRLNMGIRWWEDVYFNRGEGIYPTEFREAFPDPVEDRSGGYAR